MSATTSGPYLMDTATWRNYFQQPQSLPAPVREAISGQDRVCLSWISLWELKQQADQGRVQLPVPVADWLQFATPRAKIQLMDLDSDTAADTGHLPGEFLADSIERILVATARRHHLTVITADEKILNYPHVQSLDARAIPAALNSRDFKDQSLGSQGGGKQR